jgi:uncharacterized protein (TIGR01777 family)
MRVLVSGASGLIGSAVSGWLRDDGHEVLRLTRSASADSAHEVGWDPVGGTIEKEKLQAVEAAVHLAGESVAGGRWTAAKKQRIRDSRVLGTRLLAKTLAGLQPLPRVMISASAIGYYGDRGDEVLTEDSAPGGGFLAGVCQEWEAATGPAEQRGIRVVRLRFGMVLSARGGALAKMLLPFRLGLGGRVGSGRQYWSWITLEDAAGVIAQVLVADTMRGAVNAVSPQPVTNLEFAKTLGKALGRPAIFPMPAIAARVAFGQMADELLLCSARVRPARLEAGGYRFRHGGLAGALQAVLGR